MQAAGYQESMFGDVPLPAQGPVKFTPVQRAGDCWVKRDDLFVVAGQRGGKARTCWHLAQGARGLITAGSRQSPQVAIVAAIAKEMGIPCRVHVPSGAYTPQLQAALNAGALVIQHRPGYNSVIVARAREDAQTHAGAFTLIPFGMECTEAVRQTAAQVANIPPDTQRIVIPVGSGMSLAGVLTGLEAMGNYRTFVLGVVVGASPHKRLDKFAPINWFGRVVLAQSEVPYHRAVVPAVLPGTELELDPIYEAKCIEYLKPGDLLWVVGRRNA